MFEEEKQPPRERPLDRYSEEELVARIAELEAEIEACQRELARKRDHRSAADKLFGG